MVSNLRTCFGPLNLGKPSHAGLWLDKFLPDHETGTGQTFVEQVAKIGAPSAYTEFYERWKISLASAGVKTEEATVRGRLAIGLGGESVIETAISLHHTYGVPFIAGSALKGLASSYAHRRLDSSQWRKGEVAHNILFGDTTEAGYVTFFDALYVPDSGHAGKALWPDVITVHHPKYYQGDEPPADWDSPTPIPFLSATGSYLLALQGDDVWVERAFEILALALHEEGVGAKTSSGYGRMTIVGREHLLDDGSTEQEADKPASPIVGIQRELDAIPHDKVASEIHPFYQIWKDADLTTDERDILAQAILEKVEQATKKQRKKIAQKDWYQEVKLAAEGDANNE